MPAVDQAEEQRRAAARPQSNPGQLVSSQEDLNKVRDGGISPEKAKDVAFLSNVPDQRTTRVKQPNQASVKGGSQR